MIQAKRWSLSAVGFIILFLFLFPVYWMVVSSFKTTQEIFRVPVTLYPKQPSFDAYINVFSGKFALMSYFANSFIISLGSMIGTILLATPAAYCSARKKLKFIPLFLLFVLISQMLPSTMMALPLFSLFSFLKLSNSYIGVIIANMTISLPFVILVLRTSFLGVPKDLEDAAAIDGCSSWGAFIRVILPLVQPGLLTCAAFGFLFAWGEFLFSLTLLNDKALWPITLGMKEFIGQYGTNWGDLMALSAVSTLPIIIIFVTLQKYIIGGIVSGAVKE